MFFFLVNLVLFFIKTINIHAEQSSKINFWNIPKKGANIFNKNILRKDIKDAKSLGIEYIRLAPDKFITKNRDFLIGNSDNYQGLLKEDLEVILHILDILHKESMPVILTMLSLPGSRWRQNNNFKDDLRIWNDDAFLAQAIKFWKDLSLALKNHPAIVAYDILNEPHPEKLFSKN